MLSLSYSACYDPYNTIFRMLAILKRSSQHVMNAEALRIADFFLCFPTRLSEIRPPNSVKGMRKRNNAIIRENASDEYEILPSSQVLYERMDVIQETALSAMISSKLVSIEHHAGGRVISLTSENISDALNIEIEKFTRKNAGVLELVSRDFPAIQISGPDGLKARTGLGEFIYDTI